MAAKIEAIYRDRVVDYNAATILYKEFVKGKIPNRELFANYLETYRQTGTLDMLPFIKTIEFAVKFEVNRNYVQHVSLIAKAFLDKLLVQGPWYEKADQYAPQNIPLSPHRDRLKMKEDEDIDYDIRQGRLNLDNP